MNLIQKIYSPFLLLSGGILPAFLLMSCVTTYVNQKNTTGYNFSSPDKVIALPDTLHEVSGLTAVEGGMLACIQDENGIVFIVDPRSASVTSQYAFNINGDYEGITRVGNDLYVLRSDGTLFAIENFASENPRTVIFETGIPANNNEGLCYDARHHRLLIASKGKIGKGPEFKDRRVIYGFDLITKRLIDKPIYDFDLKEIKKFAVDNNPEIPVESKERKGVLIREPMIKFRTSAIGIHPLNGKLYLLSASDHMMFVFDKDVRPEHIAVLDSRLFNKAEGITFYENGDMMITNEGQDKFPTLLYFKYGK